MKYEKKASRLGQFILLLVVMGGLSVACTAQPTATPAPPPTPTAVLHPAGQPFTPLMPSPSYGVHLAQWWDLVALERDLNLTNEMGFGWVKQKFAWRDIEPTGKGEFDWFRPDFIVNAAEQRGLKLIVRLDRQPLWSVRSLPDSDIKDNQPPVNLADFGDFCGTLASRYKGRIAAYQVWNEPNLSREWGEKPPNPADYVALLKVCYTAIKAADPQAIVISAGLAPTGTHSPQAMPDELFLRGMYAAGGADYFDMLGLNAPGYKAPPEASPEEGETIEGYGGGRWFVFRHVEDMRRIMVEMGDGHKQVAILEMGWTTDPRPGTVYEWHAVSEQEQADYLVRAYQYAQTHWQPWIGVMSTIYLADTAWTPEYEQYWWALTLPDGTPRPSYFALQAMKKGVGSRE